MMDERTYKKEIVRMWDTMRDDKYKGIESCSGVNDCGGCPLNNIKCGESFNAFEMIKAVEKWSREHQQKKYKVSELEYYLLELCVFNHMNVLFGTSSIICYLLRRGYFKGANENMLISDYFEKCVIEVEYDR